VATLLASMIFALALLTQAYATTYLALKREQKEKGDRIRAQVQQLLDADSDAVPSVLAALDDYRDDLLPELSGRALGDLNPRQQARLRLARLFHDPEQLDPLLRAMLDPATDLAEMLALRTTLRPH